MTDLKQIGVLVAEYRALTVSRVAARNQPDLANRLFDERHSIAKVLRATEVGRRAIEALLTDPLDSVRLGAAADSLWWNSLDGIATLEDLATRRTLDGVTAKYTLREYRAGTLNLDW